MSATAEVAARTARSRIADNFFIALRGFSRGLLICIILLFFTCGRVATVTVETMLDQPGGARQMLSEDELVTQLVTNDQNRAKVGFVCRNSGQNKVATHL